MYNFFEGKNRIITYLEELVPFPNTVETEPNSERRKSQSFTKIGAAFAYRYPELNSKCKVATSFEQKSESFRLSPDGRYLAVQSVTTLALTPGPGNQLAERSFDSELYDLGSCSEIKVTDHPSHKPMFIGVFSPDSRYYVVEQINFYIGNSYFSGAIKYDLQTREIVEKFPETILGQ